jgi:hypothetical protein
MSLDLSLVIPASTERLRLPLFLTLLRRYLDSRLLGACEVIVVDDGGTFSGGELGQRVRHSRGRWQSGNLAPAAIVTSDRATRCSSKRDGHTPPPAWQSRSASVANSPLPCLLRPGIGASPMTGAWTACPKSLLSPATAEPRRGCCATW